MSYQLTEYSDLDPRSAAESGKVDVDRWMGMLAHELRGPLNAMVLALDSITAGTASGEAIPGHLARSAARQMEQIVEDVLDLCRHRHGHPPSRMEEVNLAEIVVAAVNIAKPMLMAKGHLLVVSMPGDHIPIKGQRSRLEQVLTNLLANAAHYTPSGGHVFVKVEPAAGAVVVRVRDNGVGITPTLLPYVFDYYRRGMAGQSNPFGGLGIGLAVVKTLVELHGGTVSVYSDGRGLGSEFAVHLPSGTL